MRWQERIEIKSQVLVGKPVIKRTRISVEFVIDLMGRGWSVERILREYDHLAGENIQACQGLRTSISSIRSTPRTDLGSKESLLENWG